MLGKGIPGGYAEYVTVPARNAFGLPAGVSFEHGAVMMCSSATSMHALRKGRLAAGETVAIIGAGGLGASAIQIARALGAADVFAVDVDQDKLALAGRLGATPIDGRRGDAVEAVIAETAGHGVDVALDLVGLEVTTRQAIDVLGVMGRAVLVGLAGESVDMVPFAALAPREREIIGCIDHLAQEIPTLLRMATRAELVLDDVVGASVPLDATAINAVMDGLENYGGPARTVIVP